MREAAALPLILINAWEGLIDRGGLQAGQSVLVQGGSGGVGHSAIQIARAIGTAVFATGAPSRGPSSNVLAQFSSIAQNLSQTTSRG
jgi:NADPH2:quinone reductase